MKILKIGAFVVEGKEKKEVMKNEWWKEFDAEKEDSKKILDYFESFYKQAGTRYSPIGWQKGIAKNNKDILVLEEL